jgi:endonuclease/exonuclease/phosphatase family metal-dependent hydrolase
MSFFAHALIMPVNFDHLSKIRGPGQLVEEGEHFVHLYKGYIPTDNVGFHAKNVQFIKLVLNNKPISILNFHGLWNANGKTDTEARLNQSTKIKEFADSLEGEKILCGDFNLRPVKDPICHTASRSAFNWDFCAFSANSAGGILSAE